MGLIEFSDVTFAYGNSWVLKSVDFKTRSGDFVGIVGPNGAGKTTFLKLAAGIISPNSGTIRISGKAPIVAARKGLVGYVSQLQNDNSSGFPATVSEIVALGTLRSPAKVRAHIVQHILEITGLNGYEKTLIRELSGGYRQRMMVARALAQNPRVLFLDEPTSGIDAPSGKKLFELLRNLNQRLGITIVMVSHDIINITEYMQKVVCVNKGICFNGSAAEFKNNHLHQHLLFEFPTMDTMKTIN
ncbi:MAG: metal ABC transporter ATP-binding protein [Bacillota bacterium]